MTKEDPLTQAERHVRDGERRVASAPIPRKHSIPGIPVTTVRLVGPGAVNMTGDHHGSSSASYRFFDWAR